MSDHAQEVHHDWHSGFLLLVLLSAFALFVVEVGPSAGAGQGDPGDPAAEELTQGTQTTSVATPKRVFTVAGGGTLRAEMLAETRTQILELAQVAGESMAGVLDEQIEAATTTTAPSSTTAPPTTAAPTTTAPPTTAAPTTTAPPTTAPPVVASSNDSVWDRLAACESGGNWAINTGNGYYGGLQFALATWQHHGGSSFAAYPHEASREQQIAVAERLVAAAGGSFSAWPHCSAALGLP